MKTSPFVRIREKNKLIEGYKSGFKDIASVLNCQPNLLDIMTALIEMTGWYQKYVDLTMEKNEQITAAVEKETFTSTLKAQKLELEVEKLRKTIDTKDNEINLLKKKIQGNQKGFWDFMYKVFKV